MWGTYALAGAFLYAGCFSFLDCARNDRLGEVRGDGGRNGIETYLWLVDLEAIVRSAQLHVSINFEYRLLDGVVNSYSAYFHLPDTCLGVIEKALELGIGLQSTPGH